MNSRLPIIALIGVVLFSCDVTAEDENVKFSVMFSNTLSRTEQPPTIKVTFANGIQDELELEHFKINEAASIGCNYIGRLKNDTSSVAAITGCLNNPEDVMDVTLISSNNINKMFSVDFHGNAKVVKNPFSTGQKSVALRANDGFDESKKLDTSNWNLNGDELLNYDIEHNAEIAKLTSIPSKLKATIRFGYEDGLKAAFGNDSFDEWTQSVLAHAQVHFRHKSLGTIIEFEVIANSVYKSGATWTADDNIEDARSASLKYSPRADIFSWWCSGGNFVGMAYLGGLCSSYNTNLIEQQSSTASSAYILARSIGHNLGMSNDFDDKHGGNNGPCNGKGIMSNVASTSYNQWSACSRSDWEHHYASRYWGRSCLDNISGDTGIIQGAGQCNQEDEEIWYHKHDEVTSVLDNCGTGCWGAAECTEKCMMTKTELSTNCANCFGRFARCSKSNCLPKCRLGTTERCVKCIKKYCDDGFIKCSGLSPIM